MTLLIYFLLSVVSLTNSLNILTTNKVTLSSLTVNAVESIIRTIDIVGQMNNLLVGLEEDSAIPSEMFHYSSHLVSVFS